MQNILLFKAYTTPAFSTTPAFTTTPPAFFTTSGFATTSAGLKSCFVCFSNFTRNEF